MMRLLLFLPVHNERLLGCVVFVDVESSLEQLSLPDSGLDEFSFVIILIVVL